MHLRWLTQGHSPEGQVARPRQSGHRPNGNVWVNYTDGVALEWWKWFTIPTVTIRTIDPIDRLDLRCLIGLDVVFNFPDWNERVSRLYERMQEYAQEIAVVSSCFGDDIGWFWLKDVGRVEFDDRPKYNTNGSKN